MSTKSPEDPVDSQRSGDVADVQLGAGEKILMNDSFFAGSHRDDLCTNLFIVQPLRPVSLVFSSDW